MTQNANIPDVWQTKRSAENVGDNFFVRIFPSLLLFYGAAGAFGCASAAGECGGENQRE